MSDRIRIKITPPDFEYDVYTLVKAFYPEGDVKLYKDGEEEEPQDRIMRITLGQSSFRVEFGEVMEETFPENDRTLVKNELKQCIYKILSEECGRTLPWGTLTGIRPVRIPLSMMEEGATDPEIEDRLKSTYYISDKKTELAMNVARTEKELLSGFDYRSGYSLYVGIPFCPSICLYCSFSSQLSAKADLDGYLDGLEREMSAMGDMMAAPPDSLYIGGGTPTVLSPDRLERLFSMTEKYFGLEGTREFTVEAGRPDTIDPDKLRVIKEHGATRISINPQTMNRATLDIIGRRHSVDDVYRSFEMARDLGFDNINMDLIVGLPGEGKAEVAHTMEEILNLSPESITVHSLAVKRAARLNLFKNKYREMGMVGNEEIMDMVNEATRRAGMKPYYLYRQKNMVGNLENVGYAKPGFESLYNVLIMEEKQTIIACGAGSSTKRVWPDGKRIERIINPKDIRTYLEGIENITEKKRNLLEA